MFATAEHPVIVAYVDMNGLKQINDTQAHETGDEAIKKFCAAVRRVSGRLYRIGGDEFVVIRTREPVERVADIARDILRAVAQETVGDVRLSASIEIVTASDPRETPANVIDRADAEMYRAKERSKRVARPGALALPGADPEIIQPGHG